MAGESTRAAAWSCKIRHPCPPGYEARLSQQLWAVHDSILVYHGCSVRQGARIGHNPTSLLAPEAIHQRRLARQAVDSQPSIYTALQTNSNSSDRVKPNLIEIGIYLVMASRSDVDLFRLFVNVTTGVQAISKSTYCLAHLISPQWLTTCDSPALIFRRWPRWEYELSHAQEGVLGMVYAWHSLSTETEADVQSQVHPRRKNGIRDAAVGRIRSRYRLPPHSSIQESRIINRTLCLL